MLSALLSEPLHEQSLYRVCLWFSLICLYLLLGAIAIGRSSWRRSGLDEKGSSASPQRLTNALGSLTKQRAWAKKEAKRSH
jgi:hypothetical protein